MRVRACHPGCCLQHGYKGPGALPLRAVRAAGGSPPAAYWHTRRTPNGAGCAGGAAEGARGHEGGAVERAQGGRVHGDAGERVHPRPPHHLCPRPAQHPRRVRRQHGTHPAWHSPARSGATPVWPAALRRHASHAAGSCCARRPFAARACAALACAVRARARRYFYARDSQLEGKEAADDQGCVGCTTAPCQRALPHLLPLLCCPGPCPGVVGRRSPC